MAKLLLILIYKAEEQIIKVGFQNDTNDRFVISGSITFNGLPPIPLKGTLTEDSMANLGELPFDRINDYPHFEITLERHTDKGHADTIECKIKPKPKHFIKLSLLQKWGNRPGRSYILWEESTDDEVLKNIPVPRPKSTATNTNRHSPKSGIIRDLSELAVFNRELDLHAAKLFKDLNSVSAEEIYQRQIKTFQWYMDKAKSMNIDRVFIIHGVGSGRLKTYIANKLEFDHDIATYTNEHHPKYGFGATEVVFRS